MLEDVRSLRYTARALSRLIDDVNGVEPTRIPLGNFIRERAEIGARAGTTIWTFGPDRYPGNVVGPGMGIQIGFDLAILFPMEKATFAFTIAPNFRYLRLNTDFQDQEVLVRYASLDFPIGFRTYFRPRTSFSPGKSFRYFMGAGYNLMPYFPGNVIRYSQALDRPILVPFGKNAFYGEVGFLVNKKYVVQAIYQMRTTVGGSGKFNMTSFLFGINL